MNNNIDFVLPWVNGSDPDWVARFEKYANIKEGDSRTIRFRDWELLRYWFRGIEKFAPWFRKIFFITSGELPSWLDINNPKIEWIHHEDYIPVKYLPTFSANTIEMNLHRIKELSEKFIYFNDDFFITNPVSSSRFFHEDLPCDYAVMTPKPSSGGIIHIAINDIEIIERHFDKHTVMKKHFCKWFSLKYKTKLINNILLYPWKEFSGFIDPHIPYAFLKSTLDKIWKEESDILDHTCRARFRTNNDVNQWLVRYWQLAEGKFYPKNIEKNTLCISITNETCRQIEEAISQQKYEMICMNDSIQITDFEKLKENIQKSFETILPEKCSFEKD